MRTSVGIVLRVLNGGVHCGKRLRRGPERIFVGSELDYLAWITTELARRFFYRLTRLVNGKIAQMRIRDIPNGLHRRSLCENGLGKRLVGARLLPERQGHAELSSSRRHESFRNRA